MKTNAKKTSRGRKSKPEKERVVQISASLLPQILEIVERQSITREWSLAKTAGYYIGLGVQAEKYSCEKECA